MRNALETLSDLFVKLSKALWQTNPVPPARTADSYAPKKNGDYFIYFYKEVAGSKSHNFTINI